jgi:hypothetical protein
MELAQ